MTASTKKKIKEALILGELTPYHISKIYGVPNTTVYNFRRRLILKGLAIDPNSNGVCGMLPRLESYFTEEELLYPSSPYYGAKRRDLITPIREDWKLIKFEDGEG